MTERRSGQAWLRFARPLAVLLCVLAGAAPAAAQYLLQAGDRISLSVSGLPELSGEATLDIDGTLRLPHIGAIRAADKSIDALRQEVAQRMAERPYRRYGDGGEPAFIAIGEGDVVVAVAAYRPVVISGDVIRPGPIDFSPGLTVRAAVAIAGGPVNALAQARFEDVVTLRGQVEVLSHRLVDLEVEDWRLRAELAEKTNPAIDDISRTLVSEDVFRNYISTARRQLRSNLETLERERGFLELSAEKAAERLETLRGQAELEKEAVEYDRTELERISKLLEEGLLQVDRLSDVRRAQLASETRLIQTLDRITRLEIDLDGFAHEREMLDANRRERLLAERARIGVDIAETHSRLLSARVELSYLEGSSAPQIMESVITVIRSRRGAERGDMDTVLEPGDVVTLERLPAGAAGATAAAAAAARQPGPQRPALRSDETTVEEQ